MSLPNYPNNPVLGEEYTLDSGIVMVCVQTNPNRWKAKPIPTFSGFVTPEMFGAKGDGITDDTEAVQAACDSGKEVRSGSLYATYIISGTGVFVPDNLVIKGNGRDKTIFKKKASDGTTELDPIFRERTILGAVQPVSGVRFHDIGLQGNADPLLPSPKAAGLFRCYESYDCAFYNCSFSNSRGYGVGLQGRADASDPDKRGPHQDMYFENCWFYGNGKQDTLTVTDPDDGIDCKGSVRLKMIACRAWDNGDKGFDIRGRDGVLIGCYAHNNAGVGINHSIEPSPSGVTSIADSDIKIIGCYSYSNGGAGYSVTPQATVGVVGAQIVTTYSACEAWGNAHNWVVTSEGSNALADSTVIIDSCLSKNPATGTRHFIGSGKTKLVSINGGVFDGGDSNGISVNSADVGTLKVTGITLKNIIGNGIIASTNAAGVSNICGNTFSSITGAAVVAVGNCTLSGNDYANIGSTTLVSLSGTGNRLLDKALGARTTASAAALTLPQTTDLHVISGTTTITSITASYAQRVVVLRFAASCMVTAGGNLFLNGNFSAVNNSTLTLVCDGTNWYEIGRKP